MPALRFPAKPLFSPATFAFLIAAQTGLAHAQNPGDYPTITFSPTNPVSTEPFAIIFTATLPEGTEYSATVYDGYPPHPEIATCQAVQKNGSAVCQLGRIAPGFYTTSVSGGDGIVQPFNFSISAPGPSTVSALQGQYSFLVTDQSSIGASLPGAAAAAGSFTADGQGKIFGGVMDLNRSGASFQGLPFTGSYTLNAVGQGTITLTSSQGEVAFAVAIPTAQTTLNVTNGTLIALPGGLVTGGGTLVGQSGLLQSASPVNPGFASTLNGGYQATLAGELGSPGVPVGGALQFTFSPAGSVQSAGQLTVGGGPVGFSGLTGTYTPVDGTTGRTTFTLAVPGQPDLPFAAYETSEQSFYFLSLAPHASNPLLAGTASQ